jgi:hypothetical protein
VLPHQLLWLVLVWLHHQTHLAAILLLVAPVAVLPVAALLPA